MYCVWGGRAPKRSSLDWDSGTAGCSCLDPQQRLLPCRNVLAVVRKVDERYANGQGAYSPAVFISDHFRTETWRQTWQYHLPPILIDNLAVDEMIEPPRFRVAHGQVRKKRGQVGHAPTAASQRLADAPSAQAGPSTEPKGSQTCGKCKKKGHNARSCKEPFDAGLSWLYGQQI